MMSGWTTCWSRRKYFLLQSKKWPVCITFTFYFVCHQCTAQYLRKRWQRTLKATQHCFLSESQREWRSSTIHQLLATRLKMSVSSVSSFFTSFTSSVSWWLPLCVMWRGMYHCQMCASYWFMGSYSGWGWEEGLEGRFAMKVILQWDGPPFEWSYEGVTCHVGGLTGG